MMPRVHTQDQLAEQQSLVEADSGESVTVKLIQY